MLTKETYLSTRGFAGYGRGCRPAFLEAMVPALTPIAQTAANPLKRFGVVFVPLGERPGFWTPTKAGADFEFTTILNSLEPLPELDHYCFRVVQSARRTRRQRGGMAQRIGSLPNHRRKRQGGRHGGSGHCQQNRSGHALPFARIGDRGFHRMDRRLRHGLQLCLHEYDFLEKRHHAASHGNQSPRGLRTHVRTTRHEDSKARSHAGEPQHSGFGSGGCCGSRKETRNKGSRPT